MGQIFICYSHEDQKYVNQLRTELIDQDLNVWIDKRLDIGVDMSKTIEANIAKCSAFILVMTPRSGKSEWVQRELRYALSLNKTIFPLLLEGEPWPIIKQFLYEDVRGGKSPSAKFFTDLVEIINKESQSQFKWPNIKVDTQVVVALIALVGTIVTALLASPVLVAWMQRTPTPTLTFTPTYTVTVAPTETPSETVLVAVTDTLTPTFTSTTAPTHTATLTSTPSRIPSKTPTPTRTPTVTPTMVMPANAISSANVNKLSVAATWRFNSAVFAVDISGNGRWVGVGEKSGQVTIKDLDGTLRQEYDYGNIIYDVKFSPDSKWLAVAGEAGKLMIFNTQTWATPLIIDGHSSAIKDLAFTRDGAFLISGGIDSKVQIWNVGKWDLRTTINMDRRVYALDISPAEDLIAVGKSDGHIGFFNSAGALIGEVDDTNVPTASIVNMKFSPDGKLLALASSDPSNAFQIWDVQTRKLKREFGETLDAKGLAFSPDGQMLATFTNDTLISFWRTTTAARIAYFSYHQDVLMAVVFSKDGTLVVTGSYDKTVRFWSVPK